MAGQSKATKHPDPTSNNKKKHNPCILQWNMRGMGTQGDELKALVKEFNPIAVFLQETKCKFQYLVKLDRYIPIPLSNEPYGIAIYVRSDIPFSSISLDTSLRAAAVRLTFNKRVISVCSIHLTDDSDYKVEEADLLNLVNQLSGPFLLLGDFNGHSPLWGCDKINQIFPEGK